MVELGRLLYNEPEVRKAPFIRNIYFPNLIRGLTRDTGEISITSDAMPANGALRSSASFEMKCLRESAHEVLVPLSNSTKVIVDYSRYGIPIANECDRW